MCRLLACPPGTSKKEALDILFNFRKGNNDGVGSVYIRNDKFVVNKWPKSLKYVLNKDYPFLDHMPHNGWTIVHLRAASHGANVMENTHPFIVGPWAIAHNGVWTDYNIAKLALSNTIKFIGDTDSEVAAHLINIIGPKKFSQEIDFAGVFLSLNVDGSLWIVKTSGELSLHTRKNKTVILASELGYQDYKGQLEALNGWYHFDKYGKYIKHKENKTSFPSSFYHGIGNDFAEIDMELEEENGPVPHVKIANMGDFPKRNIYHYGGYYK